VRDIVALILALTVFIFILGILVIRFNYPDHEIVHEFSVHPVMDFLTAIVAGLLVYIGTVGNGK